MWSESCEIYASPGFEAWHYYTGEAGSNGRIEVETGSKYRLWFPAWTWTYGSQRLLAVQWWVVALAETAVFWLLWRRRGRREAGFPVETP